ncbi:hypothetical protein B0H13DRAFT_2672113, partial [Mycena leptocephala]
MRDGDSVSGMCVPRARVWAYVNDVPRVRPARRGESELRRQCASGGIAPRNSFSFPPPLSFARPSTTPLTPPTLSTVTPASTDPAFPPRTPATHAAHACLISRFLDAPAAPFGANLMALAGKATRKDVGTVLHPLFSSSAVYPLCVSRFLCHSTFYIISIRFLAITLRSFVSAPSVSASGALSFHTTPPHSALVLVPSSLPVSPARLSSSAALMAYRRHRRRRDDVSGAGAYSFPSSPVHLPPQPSSARSPPAASASPSPPTGPSYQTEIFAASHSLRARFSSRHSSASHSHAHMKTWGDRPALLLPALRLGLDAGAPARRRPPPISCADIKCMIFAWATKKRTQGSAYRRPVPPQRVSAMGVSLCVPLVSPYSRRARDPRTISQSDHIRHPAPYDLQPGTFFDARALPTAGASVNLAASPLGPSRTRVDADAPNDPLASCPCALIVRPDAWGHISMLHAHSPSTCAPIHAAQMPAMVTLLPPPPFSLPRTNLVFMYDRPGASSSMPTLNPHTKCHGGLSGYPKYMAAALCNAVIRSAYHGRLNPAIPPYFNDEILPRPVAAYSSRPRTQCARRVILVPLGARSRISHAFSLFTCQRSRLPLPIACLCLALFRARASPGAVGFGYGHRFRMACSLQAIHFPPSFAFGDSRIHSSLSLPARMDGARELSLGPCLARLEAPLRIFRPDFPDSTPLVDLPYPCAPSLRQRRQNIAATALAWRCVAPPSVSVAAIYVASRSTLDPPPSLSPQPNLRLQTLECPSPSQTHQEWPQSSPRMPIVASSSQLSLGTLASLAPTLSLSCVMGLGLSDLGILNDRNPASHAAPSVPPGSSDVPHHAVPHSTTIYATNTRALSPSRSSRSAL